MESWGTVSGDAGSGAHPLRPRPAVATAGPLRRPDMANRIDARPGLGLTTRYLERDGRPWIPVSGELHYSRVPRVRWRERLHLMRSGGIDVVASYLLWIHHEPARGQARFDGGLDAAAFVRLCQQLGLEVVLRIGPWCHAEARNGGFPDWVQAAPVRHRTDDPAYLELVRPWFARLGEELGDLCGPAGPVIGIQLENELYDQPGHLLTLKGMAREAGLAAPLWTATAWGGAQLPPEEVFPLYGGYGDGFWTGADDGWSPTFRAHYLVSHTWDDPGIGADVREGEAAMLVPRDELFPPATCELGGGMATAYHRRPVPEALDIAAVALAKIAAGSAWQGYYMYAGGTNPGPGLQESHDSGYPNDLPVVDYDFHAPIGAAGLLAPSHAALRVQHAFLRAFGDRLATWPSTLPETLPAGVEDAATLRWAARTDAAGSGFVVAVWHQPHVRLPVLRGVRLELDLPGGAVTLPSEPVDVPPGTLAHWPVGIDLPAWTGGVADPAADPTAGSGRSDHRPADTGAPGRNSTGAAEVAGSRASLRLRWATASALTMLDDGTLVLLAHRGVPAEVVLDPGVTADGEGWWAPAPGVHRVHADDGGVLVLRDRLTGAVARVLVVGARDADRVWVLEGPRGRELLRCADPLWLDGEEIVVSAPARPVLHRWAGRWERLDPWPAEPEEPARPAQSRHGKAAEHAAPDGVSRIGAHPVAATRLREAGEVPASYGAREGRASAPGSGVSGPGMSGSGVSCSGVSCSGVLATASAEYRLEDVGHRVPGTVRRLHVDWAGDVAQLLVDGRVVADRFWDGTTWHVDLDVLEGAEAGRVTLRLLPLHPGAEVWLPAPAADRRRSGTGPLLALDAVSLTRSARWRVRR